MVLDISQSPLVPDRPDRVLGFVVGGNVLWQYNFQSWKRKFSFLSAIYSYLKIPLYWANLLWQNLLDFLWLDSGSNSMWKIIFSPYVKILPLSNSRNSTHSGGQISFGIFWLSWSVSCNSKKISFQQATPSSPQKKKRKKERKNHLIVVASLYLLLERVSFYENSSQFGHISFGILESLIDSYYPVGQISFGIRSPVSVIKTIFWRYWLTICDSDKKIYPSEISSIIHSYPLKSISAYLLWSQHIHTGVWCFNSFEKVRIFLNPYLLLMFIYEYVKILSTIFKYPYQQF